MKESVVEWLEEQTRKPEWHSLKRQDIFEQAKEMEKQQIIEACYFAYNEGCSYMCDGKTEYESFEQYYNETFKKQ
jgi:hypothetical protein